MKRAFALLVCLCLIPLQTARAGQPSIWFCPLDPLVRAGVGYGGATDYMSLFTPDAPWQKAASRVSVFKIYPQWAAGATDAQLRAEFADLARRHIALALEAGVVTPAPGTVAVEGMQGPALLALVHRIFADGGNLRYVAMDEPVFYTAIFKAKRVFHLSTEETVANAAVAIKAVLAKYPNVRFGELEPIVGADQWGVGRTQMLAQYQAGIEAFDKALGTPLAFFGADLAWTSPDLAEDLTAIRAMLRQEHVPLLVIYDGDGGALSNSAWLDSVRRHMVLVHSIIGAPDIVQFQSWDPYPKKLLPETDQDAFTSIIDDYFGAHTALDLAATNISVGGDLRTVAGKPVAWAPITISMRYHSASGIPATYTTTGQVPARAQTAILGIRVNSDGGSGSADIRVSGMTYDESGAVVTRDFSSPADLTSWSGLSGGAPQASATIEDGALHLVSGPPEQIVANSAAVPVIAGGRYTFTVDADIPAASYGSGSFVVLFMSGKRDIGRGVISFDEPKAADLEAQTDANGRFLIARPAPPAGVDRTHITADYNGTAADWPATASVSIAP